MKRSKSKRRRPPSSSSSSSSSTAYASEATRSWATSEFQTRSRLSESSCLNYSEATSRLSLQSSYFVPPPMSRLSISPSLTSNEPRAISLRSGSSSSRYFETSLTLSRAADRPSAYTGQSRPRSHVSRSPAATSQLSPATSFDSRSLTADEFRETCRLSLSSTARGEPSLPRRQPSPEQAAWSSGQYATNYVKRELNRVLEHGIGIGSSTESRPIRDATPNLTVPASSQDLVGAAVAGIRAADALFHLANTATAAGPCVIM